MALNDGKRAWILSLWLIVLLISLKAHTPWRDEYQSWLVSTRTPDAASFFDGVRYERHPPLLYLLQRTLVTFHPGALDWPAQVAIESITVPFTIGAALLLLFALGLSRTQATLLLFSPYLLREFGVISRVYSLGLFFLLAAVAFGQRKRFTPAFAMLALGSLTHLLFSWVCGSLFVLLAWQDRRKWRSPGFWLAGSILVGSGVLQAPPPDSVFAPAASLDLKTLWVALRGLNQALWGVEKIWAPYQWNTLPLATDLAVLLLIPALWLIRRYLDLRKFFWVCFPVALLATMGAGLNLRSLGVAFFGFVACFLLFQRPPDRAPQHLNPVGVFAFTAFFSTALWWLAWAPFGAEPKFDFAGAREWIRSSKTSGALVLVEEDALAFTWMAETKSTAFDMRRNRELRYPHFKKSEYVLASAADWCVAHLADFRKDHPNRELIFVLRKDQSFPPACGKHELVFTNGRKILTDEKLQAFRLN